MCERSRDVYHGLVGFFVMFGILPVRLRKCGYHVCNAMASLRVPHVDLRHLF